MIIHSDQLEWIELSHGESFRVLRKALGSAAGGQKLGCSLFELPVGCRAWPYHYHLANEEAIYILAGVGTLRLHDSMLGVMAGDYIALGVGSAGGAHQLINTGSEPLRYLCFSTMIEPDVTVYPDSEKVGIFAGSAPGGSKADRTLQAFLPLASQVNYWEGEGESPLPT